MQRCRSGEMSLPPPARLLGSSCFRQGTEPCVRNRTAVLTGVAAMNLSVLLNPLVSRCCCVDKTSAHASRLFPKYAVIFLLVLCSATHCNAQFDSAEVLGAIKDPSGAVVPGATVV